MDPVTLIISALATGAAASLKETASIAVKDAYKGFKALLQQKVVGKPDAQFMLKKYEQTPEDYKTALAAELKQSGLAQDAELLAAAQHLLTSLQSQQEAPAKFHTTFMAPVHNVVQGDHTIINERPAEG